MIDYSSFDLPVHSQIEHLNKYMAVSKENNYFELVLGV